RRREPRDVGGARGGDGGALTGAPRAHLGEGSTVGGSDHAGRGGRDGRVVVEDAERERLEDDALREGGFDDEQGRPGEVDLALPVAGDAAREAVVGEPVER